MRSAKEKNKSEALRRQRHLQALPIRTYREIADILARRDGVCLSTTHVRRACLSAERQLVDAILSEVAMRLEVESD